MTKGKIKIHPVSEENIAMRFQGYDEEDNPVTGCAETALTRSGLGVRSALRMVADAMRLKGYPDPEPPYQLEEYQGDTND